MKIYFSLALLGLFAFAHAQVSSTDVLFTVDGDPIKADEFIRVYNKNLDLVKDETQKDIDNYLHLFINYQLKIKEAKRLGLDKASSYLKEFTGYKDQLLKNYLSDSKVTESLMKEAYDRMGYEVKASHILIRLEENETDTLKVYQDLMALRDRVIAEGYDKVKAEVHDGQTVFAEQLGYFSAFKMVYEFENVAYNTKVGDISEPFRTQFGYHIVKVEDKRPSLGEVTVAHIMVNTTANDSVGDAEVRIHEIYKKIKQGEDFESLAKQFSDDKSSALHGGELTPFTSGQLSAPEFESVAFGLNSAGELSKPFKTDYGWHIIKLLNKTEPLSYEESQDDIKNKMKRDARSKLINTPLAKDLRAAYNVTPSPNALAYFESILDANFFSRSWELPDDFDKDKTLLTIQKDTIRYEDFGNWLLSIQQVYAAKTMPFKTVIEKEYKGFEEDALIQYHKEHLEFENKEFGYILKEYRDGLLLFDLMEQEVWKAAISDTLGLRSYYERHKDAYFWDARVDAVIATSAKEKNILKVQKLWRKGTSFEEIDKELNTHTEQKVIFTEGIKPIDYQGFPQKVVLKTGLSKVYFYNNAYHLINVNTLLPKTYKTLEEAKGKLISDYQNVLEDNWLKQLKNRYKVIVDTAVLQNVKTEISISK